MFLPRGVTGFSARNESALSRTDYQAFRGHCYAVARETGWSVRRVMAPRQLIACNYALAIFETREAAIAIALNGVYPLLAFATPLAESRLELDFVDSPALMAAFEPLGYTVLRAAELDRPVTREMWQELEKQEQKQIQYFRPRRVGDVIFNFWD